MNMICGRHLANPEKIYGQCVGCELESLRKTNKKLEQELKEYREEENRPRFKMDREGNLTRVGD